MDSARLLKQLESDGIENLWIIYHDYGGSPRRSTRPQVRSRTASANNSSPNGTSSRAPARSVAIEA